MARKKKQKKSASPKTGIDQEKKLSASAAGAPAVKLDAAQIEPEPMDIVKGGTRKVSVATCIGGMLLALALGLYIGTLLPGMLERPRETAAPAPQAAATEAPQPPSLEPRLKAAIAELEKQAAASPDSAPVWINLGNMYFDAHMPHDAITAYEHALKLAPENADVLTDLGIMYRETGDYEKAVMTFRKACEVDPNHQNAMFNEGVVLANDLHRRDEAKAAWQRLLKINPKAAAPNGEPLEDMINNLR